MLFNHLNRIESLRKEYGSTVYTASEDTTREYSRNEVEIIISTPASLTHRATSTRSTLKPRHRQPPTLLKTRHTQTTPNMPSPPPKSDPYIIYGRGGAGNIRTSPSPIFPHKPPHRRTQQLTPPPRPPQHNPQRLALSKNQPLHLPTHQPLRITRQLLRSVERQIRRPCQAATCGGCGTRWLG